MYAARSQDLSLEYMSWIAEELRERARIREEARLARWNFPVMVATAALAAFKFLVP